MKLNGVVGTPASMKPRAFSTQIPDKYSFVEEISSIQLETPILPPFIKLYKVQN